MNITEFWSNINEFVTKGPIDDKLSLVQVMFRRCTDGNAFLEPRLT